MKPADRSEVIRRLRLAKRLADEALVHFATGDEMQAEAHRLVAEVLAVEANDRPPERLRCDLRNRLH